jgi:hypothetical protein
MFRIIRFALTAGLMLFSAACASTSSTDSADPLEAQNRATNARMARIYFMWPAMIGSPWPIGIAVDGKQVAKIRANTYVFVDRPPGKHKIAMQGVAGIAWTYEAEIEVGPGTHYYELGPSGGFDYPIGYGAFSRAANGVTGKQVKGSPYSPGLVFLEVSGQKGPAQLAKLTPLGGS